MSDDIDKETRDEIDNQSQKAIIKGKKNLQDQQASFMKYQIAALDKMALNTVAIESERLTNEIVLRNRKEIDKVK